MGYEPRLRRADLPPLYRTASDRAQAARRVYEAGTAIGLFMLIVGAAAGLFVFKRGPADWAGVVALGAFAVAIVVRVHRLITRPDKIWYQGRAIAEEVKSEAWRYIAGGEPYPIVAGASGDARDADTLMVQRLNDILTQADRFPFLEPQHTDAQISQAMRNLRGAPFDERKVLYVEERLRNQQAWYARKVRANRRVRRAWNAVLLILEIAGVGAGLAKALGLLGVDLLGMTGTVVGAGTSWLQVKQYTAIEQRYAYSAHQLAIQQIPLDSITPAQWPAFVAQIENALEEEHKQWLASRHHQ